MENGGWRREVVGGLSPLTAKGGGGDQSKLHGSSKNLKENDCKRSKTRSKHKKVQTNAY